MTQNEALEILKTGANVFLTGEPGAGKTHTVNTYVEYLRTHGIEPAITASTGIAATHIHGQTIHSWSGIGIRRSLSPYDLEHIATTEYLVRRIKRTNVLIIDEVSMIDARTLDMVDMVCREIRQRAEAFGGMQVVLVGDFFQLPPIAGRGEAAQFAFESTAWKSMRAIVCYLTEQFRQHDDAFLSVLSAIRNGTYDEMHHEHLKKRHIDAETAHAQASEVTRLFPHNIDVDAINATELAKLPGILTPYHMETKGRDVLVASLQKGCLSPELLELKIGAIVMCTKNNAQQGYANGTLGTVAGFEPGTKYPVVMTRDGHRIVIEPAEWAIEENGKQRAVITQVPLRLAWAITIHKSQGMSLDAAVMDLREVFEYGQGYVALSRVRALSGLHLLGWNQQALAVHPQIRTVDARFVHDSQVAMVTFGDLPKTELETMQRNFILASGGTVAAKQKKELKVPTIDATLMLVLQGKPLGEIAKTRNLAPVTILGHIEKLVDAKRLSYDDIDYLIDAAVKKGVGDIKRAFIAHDTTKLAPVYEIYKGRYTYDQLRFARMMITLGYPH